MCCFAGAAPVHVHETSIFARLTGPTTQALVYQMRYESSAPTAMILPLPVALPASDATVAWKDFKGYPNFFEALERGFPEPPRNESSRSKSAPEPQAAAAAPLPVHEVGDFIATFVPSVNDFARVDERFRISKDVWAKIPGYADYGFAVFQLESLSGVPHPIAFTFETRMPDRVYFPTVHIHDGTVHAQDEFDHVLYVQDARFDSAASDEYRGPDALEASGFARSFAKADAFGDPAQTQGMLDGRLLLHRATMRGTHPNVDRIVSLPAPGTRAASAGCSRCAVEGAAGADGTSGAVTRAIGPSGLAVTALAWIIRRRDALRD